MSAGMNRRDFLALSSASLLSQAAGRNGSQPDAQAPATAVSAGLSEAQRALISTRQNIILFMPDEMRADSLACYGNPVTRTPNFDRVAREGARFKNCHVQFPVCGASRCAMLTGWPTSVRGHRSLYYFLKPDEPNLFRYLKQSGYDVFWFGKNDALAPESFADSVTHWEDDAKGPQHPLETVTPGSLTMFFKPGGTREDNKDYRRIQGAINVLRRKEQTKPFFIFLAMTEPHPPYTAPDDFFNMYDPKEIPPLTPPGLKRKPIYHEGIRRRYALDKVDDATLRRLKAVYYGKVSYSDWLLGELLSVMEETGRDKDTSLLITSDHGDYTGDFGLIEKWPSGLEDCLTHVPLIARIPGGKSGVVASDMVEQYDVMQTCLDIAGIAPEHTHFSRSLISQVAGGPGDAHRNAFSEGGYNIYEPQCFEPLGAGGAAYKGKIELQNYEPRSVSRSSMVRTRTHKLVMRTQDQCELYDMVADPHEIQNLFGERSSASIQEQLQVKLLNHYLDTTGIAPMRRDGRGAHDAPPPVRKELMYPGWQAAILDR